MTSSEVRRVFGRTVSYSQSDFIGEIRNDLKEYVNQRSANGTSKEGMYAIPSKSNFNNPHSLKNSIRSKMSHDKISNTFSNSANLEEITLGRKVKHDKFGEGTVVSIMPSGNDKKITIAFDKQGVKVLLLSMARLQLL